MAVLLLKLAAPLQSWGSDSRFAERKTQHEPTKSGVIGLVAAALGRRREDSIDDLAALRFGVRIDQPGNIERDFQAEHTRDNKRPWDGRGLRWPIKDSLPLTYRYYLSDAVFVAALEGDGPFVQTCTEALEHPVFPLFLGRRSCPPSCKVLLGVEEGMSILDALGSVPWQSAAWYQSQYRFHDEETVKLEVLYDKRPADHGEGYDITQRDVPVSYSQVHRQYTWRTVAHATVAIRNPSFRPKLVEHDPLSTIDGMVG